MSLLVPTPRLRHVLRRGTSRPLGNDAPTGLLPRAAHATKCQGNTDGRSALLLSPRLLPWPTTTGLKSATVTCTP